MGNGTSCGRRSWRGLPVVRPGSARSVVYLGRHRRHAVFPVRAAKSSIILGKTAALDALAATPHGAFARCEHVKYLALSLLSWIHPACGIRSSPLCTTPARPLLAWLPSRTPRGSSRQTQPCLIRGLTRLLYADEPPRGAAATGLPFIRPPPGLQSLFALHPSPYVTQIATLRFNPERTPSNCISALPVVDHHCNRQKSIRCTVSWERCSRGLQSQARAHICSSRSRLTVPSGWTLPHGETTQGHDSDWRMIYAMLQV